MPGDQPQVFGESEADRVEREAFEREDRAGELYQILTEFAVYSGSRPSRRGLAAELARDGMTAEDLRLLGEDAQASTDTIAKAGSRLAWRLSDPERWQPMVEDLRIAAGSLARRRGSLEDDGPPPPENHAVPWDDQVTKRAAALDITPEQLQRDRDRNYAYCRVRGDKAEPRNVAAELGVTPTELEQLLAAEEATR